MKAIVTIEMEDGLKKIAIEDSVKIFGSPNISGYIRYLITKERKEK